MVFEYPRPLPEKATEAERLLWDSLWRIVEQLRLQDEYQAQIRRSVERLTSGESQEPTIRRGGGPVIIDLGWEQTNPIVASYLATVSYDPADTETTYINDYYTIPTDYRKDWPTAGALALRTSGTLTVTDGGRGVEDQVEAGEAQIHSLTPGRASTYAVISADRLRQTGTLTPYGQLRMIRAGPVWNVRDLGGWPCDGGRLRYGLIFRGGEMDGTHGISIGQEGRRTMLELLGIRAETDFRSTAEASGSTGALGPGVDYLRISCPQYLEAVDLSGTKAGTTANVLRRLLGFLLAGAPQYIHCVSGCDRTGTIAFLLSAVCGVGRSDLDKDYEISSFSDEGVSASRSRVLSGWQSLVGYINTMDGPTYRDKAVSWWVLAGFTIQEINALRGALINGTPEPVSSHVDYTTKAISLNFISFLGVASESFELAAARSPVWATSAISWASSNPAAATVSGSGTAATVNLIAPGSAIITATSNGKSASCAVSVSSGAISYTTVSTGTVLGDKIDSSDHSTVTHDQPLYAASGFVSTTGYSRYRLSNAYDGMPHDGASISNVYINWYDAEQAYIGASDTVAPNKYAAMDNLTGVIPNGATYFRVRCYSGENETQRTAWFNAMTVELGTLS